MFAAGRRRALLGAYFDAAPRFLVLFTPGHIEGIFEFGAPWACCRATKS